MRFLVVGDLHGDLLAAKDLAKKATYESVDLVLISGDLTMFGQNYEGIVGSFVSEGLKTGIIHGNHDDLSLIEFLSNVYGVTNFHGVGKKYNNIGVFGCGGANIGLNRLTEDEIFNHLVTAHSDVSDMEKKIMVTHVHPSDTKIASLSSFVRGSTGVRRAVEELQPDVLFCSHVHEAEGLEEQIGKTKVFCVGKQSKIIDL
ncbi:metallophosphoesterase [Candidatus Woesearchaeota archaeon]|nr:metallophosphoesterase [Candidatus Woesearchaeota archaeon]